MTMLDPEKQRSERVDNEKEKFTEEDALERALNWHLREKYGRQ